MCCNRLGQAKVLPLSGLFSGSGGGTLWTVQLGKQSENVRAQAGFLHAFLTDSKEPSSTQTVTGTTGVRSKNQAIPLQAQELSYLFDFIDIDESGQVNKEDRGNFREQLWFVQVLFSDAWELKGNTFLGNRLRGRRGDDRIYFSENLRVT